MLPMSENLIQQLFESKRCIVCQPIFRNIPFPPPHHWLYSLQYSKAVIPDGFQESFRTNEDLSKTWWRMVHWLLEILEKLFVNAKVLALFYYCAEITMQQSRNRCREICIETLKNKNDFISIWIRQMDEVWKNSSKTNTKQKKKNVQ